MDGGTNTCAGIRCCLFAGFSKESVQSETALIPEEEQLLSKLLPPFDMADTRPWKSPGPIKLPFLEPLSCTKLLWAAHRPLLPLANFSHLPSPQVHRFPPPWALQKSVLP